MMYKYTLDYEPLGFNWHSATTVVTVSVKNLLQYLNEKGFGVGFHGYN